MNCEKYPIGAKMSILGKLFKEVVKEYCLNNGINETYSKVIMMLSKHPEGVIQNEIVDNTYLKKSTISTTLKNMEQYGYITRELCPFDNRKIIVKITDKGILLDKEIRRCYEHVEKSMINEIEKEDLDLFNSIIKKMKDNLERQKGEFNV